MTKTEKQMREEIKAAGYQLSWHGETLGEGFLYRVFLYHSGEQVFSGMDTDKYQAIWKAWRVACK